MSPLKKANPTGSRCAARAGSYVQRVAPHLTHHSLSLSICVINVPRHSLRPSRRKTHKFIKDELHFFNVPPSSSSSFAPGSGGGSVSVGSSGVGDRCKGWGGCGLCHEDAQPPHNDDDDRDIIDLSED